jgi:hypothetical protein
MTEEYTTSMLFTERNLPGVGAGAALAITYSSKKTGGDCGRRPD